MEILKSIICKDTCVPNKSFMRYLKLKIHLKAQVQQKPKSKINFNRDVSLKEAGQDLKGKSIQEFTKN